MPDWIAVPIVAVLFPLAVFLFGWLMIRLDRKMQKERRERRRQALEDYFEAKERYEKRKNS